MEIQTRYEGARAAVEDVAALLECDAEHVVQEVRYRKT